MTLSAPNRRGLSSPSDSSAPSGPGGAPAPLPLRDWIAISLFGAFIVCGFTIELYWLLHIGNLPALADHSFMANLFRIYAAGDRHYYDDPSALAVFLESFNVYFTQLLNAVIIYGIAKRRPWREPLQLVVCAYVSYSVLLYFGEAHIAGYPAMPVKSAWGFFIFIAPNLPWLLGHLYMLADSFVRLTRRLRAAG